MLHLTQYVLIRHGDWTVAVECLAVLDVLMSFAEYSRGQQGDLCIPQFVSPESCAQVSQTIHLRLTYRLCCKLFLEVV